MVAVFDPVSSRIIRGSPVQLAVIGAALMMSHHVAAKSVRDALFLSHFDVTSLPVMVMGASGFSLLLVLVAAQAMRRLTPARIVPAAFAVSSVLYITAGLLLPVHPRLTAVALFLLVVGAGTLITSGFWTLVSERLDPNTVRRHVGHIAAGGTIGVIVGGILVERVGALMSIEAVFPVLGALHMACSFISLRLVSRTGRTETTDTHLPQPGGPDRDRIANLIRQAPYLHLLALVVVMGTVGAGLIDYVFKAQSVAILGRGEGLLRFFAVFNSGVGLLTFLLQVTASRNALHKLGVGKTLGSLPAIMAIGSFGAMVAPGLVTAGLARGAEAVLRGSLFRTGYELFYAPVPVGAKRAAKPIIDVGFDRLGDGLAGGLVGLLLFLPAGIAIQAVLTIAVILGLVGAYVALKLQETYVGVLENNLLRRAEDLELGQFGGSILSSMTMISIPLSHAEPESESLRADDERRDDRLLTAFRYMVSGDPTRVSYALRDYPTLDPLLVPVAIRLLASDTVYAQVLRALRTVADENVGQLVDALLQPETAPTVRRRIPRILSHCRSQRATEGLLLGLRDRSFEVRCRCGQALTAVGAGNPEVSVSASAIYDIAKWEVSVGRPAATIQRSPDIPADEDTSYLISDSLKGHTDYFLEHIFTLLSLTLPREPLRVAFHGLHTSDKHLRGTALEYLESVLPPEIFEILAPHFVNERSPNLRHRTADEVADALMQSQESIMLNLEGNSPSPES